MPTIRAEVRMPYSSGLPRDVSVNVFHWSVDEANELAFTNIAEKLASFYNDDHSGEDTALANYIAPFVSRVTNECQIRFSNVDEDPSPILFVADWTLAASGSAHSLPAEVALAITWVATPLLPVPIRRRRGRTYIGPLASGAIDSTPGSPARPEQPLIDIWVGAAEFLVDDELDFERLVVWSRVNDQAYEVSGGWVDNEWDTQRPRGLDPTNRTSFTAG